ncbi:hypothetical protein SNK04_014477 [Fusarium graminearum]
MMAGRQKRPSGVDEPRVLLLIDRAHRPLVVAGHGDHAPALLERRSEGRFGGHRLDSGVDGRACRPLAFAQNGSRPHASRVTCRPSPRSRITDARCVGARLKLGWISARPGQGQPGPAGQSRQQGAGRIGRTWPERSPAGRARRVIPNGSAGERSLVAAFATAGRILPAMLPMHGYQGFRTAPPPSGWVQLRDTWVLWWSGRQIAQVSPAKERGCVCTSMPGRWQALRRAVVRGQALPRDAAASRCGSDGGRLPGGTSAAAARPAADSRTAAAGPPSGRGGGEGAGAGQGSAGANPPAGGKEAQGEGPAEDAGEGGAAGPAARGLR